MIDFQSLQACSARTGFNGYRTLMALLLVAVIASGCASKTGAWSKQLIAGREVSGNAQKVYTDKLWRYVQGYTEGDLVDVESFYNPKRIDGVDNTLMGMIGAVRLPKSVEGWEQQARHFGLTITGFAGVLRRGSVEKKNQPQFVAAMGTDRPWPEYQLLYTTNSREVFAIIHKGQLTHLAREVRPHNKIPGPESEFGSSWLSEEFPNTLRVYSFAQIRKRRRDELQGTLPKYDTNIYEAHKISQMLPEGVTADLRTYIASVDADAQRWFARHNALIDKLQRNDTLPAATLVAIADEYNRARPEAMRVDPKVESPHFVAPLFRKHFEPAIARAKQDGRIATAAGLALQLFRVEKLDPKMGLRDDITLAAALDEPDSLLGRARKLAVHAYLESALLLKPAKGLENLAARSIPNMPPLLTERLAIKPANGNEVNAAADRLGLARLSIVELPPTADLKPSQYLKDYQQSSTVTHTTSAAEMREWEREYQDALDRLRTADDWHRARIADIKKSKSEYKNLQGAEPEVSDPTWALAQDKALREEQLSYQSSSAAARNRVADLEARRPVVGSTTERKSDALVRYRCLAWEGNLTRRLMIDPEGSPSEITTSLKVTRGQFGGDCIETTSTSDLPIESFYHRTEQRILDAAGFDAFTPLAQALTADLDKRRAPKGELPGTVKGDTSDLALEKALRAAYIGRGPWPTPPLE